MEFEKEKMKKPRLFRKIYLFLGIAIFLFFTLLSSAVFYKFYTDFKNNSKNIKEKLTVEIEKELLLNFTNFTSYITDESNKLQLKSEASMAIHTQDAITLAKGLLIHYSPNSEATASKIMRSLLNVKNDNFIFYDKKRTLLVGKNELWIDQCEDKISETNKEVFCYKNYDNKNEIVHLKYFDSYKWIFGSTIDVLEDTALLQEKVTSSQAQREFTIRGKTSKIILFNENGFNVDDNSYLSIDLAKKSLKGEFVKYAQNGENLYAYVKKFPLWDWTLILPTTMINADDEIAVLKKRAIEYFIFDVLVLCLVFIAMFLLLVFGISWIHKKQNEDILKLEDFFENLIAKKRYLNINQLHFEETFSLGQKANKVLDKKIMQQESLQKQRKNISGSDGFFLLVDRDFVIKSASDTFFLFFPVSKDKISQGITLYEVVGTKFFEDSLHEIFKSVLAGKLETQDMWLTNIQKESKFIHFNYLPYYDDASNNPSGVVVSTTDITEFATAKKSLYETKQRMNFLLSYDSITALPNFSLFSKNLGEVIQNNENETNVTVYYLKLDGLEKIYNGYGYEYKDNILVLVADKLKSVFGDFGLLTRTGDDEFIGATQDIASDDDIANFIKNIISIFENSFFIKDKSFVLSLNVGVLSHLQQNTDVANTIQSAKLAMHQAKDLGKNNYCFYKDHMHSTSLRLINLENDLKESINKKDFILYYQPLIDLKSMKVVGFEALVRWLHPRDGIVYPDSFMAHAERTGMIIQIGKIILEKACIDCVTLEEEIGFKGRVAINISGIQIEQSDFLETLKSIVAKTKANTSCLEIEITESVLMKNSEKWISLFKAIQNMGIKIAIDDFGTGYSSLNYIRSIPADKIKIDKTFIQDVPNIVDACKVVQSIIALAKISSKTVLAEGIENIEQNDFLKNSDCDIGQGFLYARPMPLDKLLLWCRSKKS